MKLYHYVILPRLQVQNANAQPILWMIAPPSMMAYSGFAHAFALAVGASTHAGFAVVHHDIAFQGEISGGEINPHQFRAAQFIDKVDYSSKSKYALSSQPTARCHMTVSLVIRFDAESSINETKIEPFLRAARIAGGSIVQHRFSIKDKTLILPRANYSRCIADRVGGGFSLKERKDLMFLQSGDKDRLDPFIRTITRPFDPLPEGPVDPLAVTDNRKWITPTTLGYMRVTELAERSMVRNGLLHAFAEPLLGFIEYQSVRHYPLSFWTMQWPSKGAYVVSTDEPGCLGEVSKNKEHFSCAQ